MRVAITGAGGFIGRNLAERLSAEGHETVRVARKLSQSSQNGFFIQADLSDATRLAHAFEGCHAVAHCAGINREIGQQTFERVHVEGTRNVVKAAREAGVKRILLMSFLRARPNCNSRITNRSGPLKRSSDSQDWITRFLKPGLFTVEVITCWTI
jgi:NADH dehydrogenase